MGERKVWIYRMKLTMNIVMQMVLFDFVRRYLISFNTDFIKDLIYYSFFVYKKPFYLMHPLTYTDIIDHFAVFDDHASLLSL